MRPWSSMLSIGMTSENGPAFSGGHSPGTPRSRAMLHGALIARPVDALRPRDISCGGAHLSSSLACRLQILLHSVQSRSDGVRQERGDDLAVLGRRLEVDRPHDDGQ